MEKYSLYKTLDESFTFKNHYYNENYHSNAGAWQEAQIKYFDACKIEKKINTNKIVRILELGFGLGYNLIPVFLHFKKKPVGRIEFISFEKDLNLFDELIFKSSQLYPPNIESSFIQLLENKQYVDEYLDIKIISNDIRNELVKTEISTIDAIYHDPFSPYKNSECWTLELFQEYYRILKKDGILSTYSISTPVRSGLFQAGFDVWKGVGDQTKSGGTIASKYNQGFVELSEHEKNKLISSAERIPFTDPDFKSNMDEIKSRRLYMKERDDFHLIKRTI